MKIRLSTRTAGRLLLSIYDSTVVKRPTLATHAKLVFFQQITADTFIVRSPFQKR